MKKTKKIISCLFLIIVVLSSCKNPVQDLSHPLTVKGMKLGMSYKKQIEIGEKNGLCVSDNNKDVCNYKLTETMYAIPNLLYSLYNGKKVLGQVKLEVTSPYNFPWLTNENNETVAEYPSITKSELKELIYMYKKKYGKSESTKWEQGGNEKWSVNDLHIEIEYIKTKYTYIIDPQIKWAFENDGLVTTVTYEYVKEIKSKLKNDITHNGKPIGDKI